MPALLYDAHCHAFDAKCDVTRSVLNGTEPDNWKWVIETAKDNSRALPAIGLHPWQVNNTPADWKAQFADALKQAQAIGEIGLDEWIDGHDMERQEEAFRWQLEQAAERNLPVSIHCLKASAALLRILKEVQRPKRGIHLHAYAGSAEQVSQFADLDAYFSFHVGQLEGHAKKAPAATQAVPGDRLLIETDAPDTLDASTDITSHLKRGYTRVAELRGTSVEALADQVASNFKRYFLND